MGGVWSRLDRENIWEMAISGSKYSRSKAVKVTTGVASVDMERCRQLPQIFEKNYI